MQYFAFCTRYLIRYSFTIHILADEEKGHIPVFKNLKDICAKRAETTLNHTMRSNAILRNFLIPSRIQFYSPLFKNVLMI